MTKTSATAAITPDGRNGYRITCDCSTHKGTSGTALVAFPIAEKNIHGTVVMAHHPAAMMQQAAASKGIWKA